MPRLAVGIKSLITALFACVIGVLPGCMSMGGGMRGMFSDQAPAAQEVAG